MRKIKNITMENNYLTPQEIEFYNQLDRWDKEAEILFSQNNDTENDENMVHHSIVGGQQNTINMNPDKLLSRLEILRQINYEKEALSDEDAAGHIWWNKFEEMIKYL